jgi:Flp pilus assembly protein TadG
MTPTQLPQRCSALYVFGGDREGSVLLEFALVLPVLLMLVLGALEFSWFFYQSHVVASGLRDATRYLAKTANPAASANQAVAQHLATTGTVAGGTSRLVGWTDASVSFCVAPNGARCASECGEGAQVVSQATSCGGSRACRNAPPVVVLASTSFPVQSLGFFHLIGLRSPTLCLWHEERSLPDAAGSN